MTTKIGVRELVEFVLRSGDLNARQNSQNTAAQGARIHRQLQKKHAADNYQREIYLKKTVHMNGQDYVIDGRADGIYQTDKQNYRIEEIKTSDNDFSELTSNTLTLYWGQVKVYGYFLMEDQNLDEITLQLIYYQTTTEQITQTDKTFTKKELKDFFQSLIDDYEFWLVLREEWHQKRNASIKQVTFPFPEYRAGQRELAVAVYKTIVLQKRLFVEAPTGTGKTISTLFPTVKALGEDKIQRVFYLTAKQSTRHVAEEAVQLLSQQGLQLKSITLTAKDKIIFPEEIDVAPDKNPYMLGYYDRLKPALQDLLENENQLTRTVIETYARKHQLDPFEFSLDASLFADIIICDYNYLFDPIVYLQRFFSEPDKDNFFLIDEAHNLVSRSRDMYSAELTSGATNQLIQLAKKDHSAIEKDNLVKQTRKLKRSFTAITKGLRDTKRAEEASQAPLDKFNNSLNRWLEFIHDWLPAQPDSSFTTAVLNLYFSGLTYLKIADLYNETYQTLLQYDEATKSSTIKQLCLDPSTFLDQSLKKGAGAVLFSATLSPVNYYREVLGNDETSLAFQLPSPFSATKQAIMIAQYVQTTYQKRAANLTKIVMSLGELVQAKQGNYLFFFPSYSYLETVYAAFQTAYPDIKLTKQVSAMTDLERQGFLAQFKELPTQSLVGFCVLGGIFAEGIDLKGSRLIGVAIVSVGLPGLSTERNLVRDYFDHKNGAGFQYAYQLPGMNHVLQAAGRLIRGSQDAGPVLLLDQRFGSSRYTKLFPSHWQRYQRVRTLEQLSKSLHDFWQNNQS
ncbi:ATP-dependent DNA helicase [Loigolactobacillus iwatensis]|uniref:ATP-dependent DNA helicase n=1 Tax=Loigolactobacillus iwatensis TaxID=1267156 RepID=UPI000F7F15BF|nr:ATP-dependent DNA helicase [Loigolactobacillus iwatensis]